MPGFSNITGDESVMFADNVSFDGTERGGKITTNGQILIGATASPRLRVGSLTSTGGSITITSGAGTINLEGATFTATTYQTDSGDSTPAANVLLIVGGEGIDVTGGSNVVTVRGEDSTYTNKGVASFSSTDFVVTNGAVTLSGGAGVSTLTTDVGTATQVAGNINILGTAAQGISTAGAASTVTLTVSSATETQKGVLETSTDAESIAGAATGVAVVPSSLKAKLGTQTLHGVLIGAGTTAAIVATAAGSAGQVLQSGGAAADPVYSTATYPALATTTGTILRADGTNWVITTSTYPATNAVSTLLYASASNVMSALATANNGALVTSNTGVPSVLAGPGTTGNVLQSNAAAAPSFSTATYPTIATGTGTLLRADGTNWVATTSTYPTTNAVSTLLYASASNVMSALATANNGMLVTSNTGVPSILAGPGTTGNILQSNAAAAPSFSTATYPSVATGTGTILRADGTNWVATTATYPTTTTVSQILYSSATNVVSGLATANNGVLITSATGVPSLLAAGTTGQVLTATTGSPATWATPAASGGLTWTVITIDQSAVAANGYICNKGSALVLTLPASGAIGDIIRVTGINTALGWSIAQNANQQVFIGTSSTSVGVGGSISSINIRDSVELVCVVAGASTVWSVISSIGNFTIV